MLRMSGTAVACAAIWLAGMARADDTATIETCVQSESEANRDARTCEGRVSGPCMEKPEGQSTVGMVECLSTETKPPRTSGRRSGYGSTAATPTAVCRTISTTAAASCRRWARNACSITPPTAPSSSGRGARWPRAMTRDAQIHQSLARSTYDPSAVMMTTRVPEPMCGGTMPVMAT